MKIEETKNFNIIYVNGIEKREKERQNYDKIVIPTKKKNETLY